MFVMWPECCYEFSVFDCVATAINAIEGTVKGLAVGGRYKGWAYWQCATIVILSRFCTARRICRYDLSLISNARYWLPRPNSSRSRKS